MCTNGVWQLQKLALRFCKADGASKGMRDFIQGPMIEFASANPQLLVQTVVQPNKVPRVHGEYADGSTKEIPVKNLSSAEIAEVVQRLRDSSTGVVRKLQRPVATSKPSVQGIWDASITYSGFSMREGKVPSTPAKTDMH